MVHSRSLDAVAAASALNWLLGSVGKGVLPPGGMLAETRPRFGDAPAQMEAAEIIFLDGVNPAYALPGSAALLAKAPLVVSFSPFLDDSAAYAEFVLPDHDALESASVIAPSVARGAALTGARPAVRPLYDTRAVEEVLAELAGKLGRPIEVETPERVYERFYAERKPAGNWADAADFARYANRQGGWWEEGAGPGGKCPTALPAPAEAEDGADAERFPYVFQPYPTMQFGDGSGAHLPWLEELPDPGSSAMWGLPVEIDAATARKLGVRNGDRVRVISRHGRIEAAVYVHPAAIPGVVSMGIGGGHAGYTRYASGVGANPLAIAGARRERGTGVLAFAGTRVRIERAEGRGGLVQFSEMDREPEVRRR
jgi:anaerobic selenocysteine-containing dehydrogenase